jgi:hypothetical protein
MMRPGHWDRIWGWRHLEYGVGSFDPWLYIIGFISWLSKNFMITFLPACGLKRRQAKLSVYLRMKFTNANLLPPDPSFDTGCGWWCRS